MNFNDKKIKNRPFNVPIRDRIFRSLVLKLAWKSLQALKFSNSLTFPEFWIKYWNSLTFPGSPSLHSNPVLIRKILSLKRNVRGERIFSFIKSAVMRISQTYCFNGLLNIRRMESQQKINYLDAARLFWSSRKPMKV